MTAPYTLTDRTVAGVRLIEVATARGVIATAYEAGGWIVDLTNPIEAVDHQHACHLLNALAQLHGSGFSAVAV